MCLENGLESDQTSRAPSSSLPVTWLPLDRSLYTVTLPRRWWGWRWQRHLRQTLIINSIIKNICFRERDEVDGGSNISAKRASSSLLSKILSCADGDCGLVNSGRGGSGDSPSTGVPSGASWAVATACLMAVWAVGVGKGGRGSASAMVSPRAVGDEDEREN